MFLTFCASPSFARTTTTFGQNAVGVACNNVEKATDFDAIAQCNSGTGAGTMQTAPIIVGTVTAPPYAATTCDANKAGMIQWTGSAFQGCDGVAWATLGSSGSSTPAAFSFTNQTGVALSTTITSNAVTLTGFSGTVSATCGAGCTAIARNGVWGGATVNGFVSGDTIAIRQTSSASANTATNATVTAGTTTSGTWVVTTNDTSPNAITFTDQTGVYTAAPISSNDVTLAGFTGTATATCNAGCTGIARNGVWGGTTVTGFVVGDTIRIKQTSSSSASTATTATVTVGSTTSATWTVTTGVDSCAGITTVGGVCPDGTLYAGITPDGNKKMMTTRCDAGQTWSGSACTGTAGTGPWATTVTGIYTGYSSLITGKTNTEGLAQLFNADSPYPAALYCYDLVADGHSDWYLPAGYEADVMGHNAEALNFTVDLCYHTSSEVDDDPQAMICYNYFYAFGGYESKGQLMRARCVRTD